MSFRRAWTVDWRATARRVWAEMVVDDCFGASAQLAFYFLLAFFPFVVFLAALATLVAHMPPAELEGAAFRLLGEVMPQQAVALVEANVTDLLRLLQERNLRVLGVSVLLALWTAAGGMRAVIVVLNRAWSVREGRGPWRVYGVSLLLTVALGLTFLVAVPLLSFASAMREAVLLRAGPGWATAWQIASRIVALGALVFGVELVYYVAPNARRAWSWVTAGSIVAVLLWVTTTWMFSQYVTRFGRYEALYAGLGAPVVLLLWFYLTGLALMIGGEINAEIERQSGILPQAAVPAPPGLDAAGHDTTIRDRAAAARHARGD
jgi:membrane protein